MKSEQEESGSGLSNSSSRRTHVARRIAEDAGFLSIEAIGFNSRNGSFLVRDSITGGVAVSPVSIGADL
jgi:hypothetical protein